MALEKVHVSWKEQCCLCAMFDLKSRGWRSDNSLDQRREVVSIAAAKVLGTRKIVVSSWRILAN